jgi:hypothetical protein
VIKLISMSTTKISRNLEILSDNFQDRRIKTKNQINYKALNLKISRNQTRTGQEIEAKNKLFIYIQ